MEHLTRQQTILVALLVAIVTSVATAITVVSLTDETSTPTQTIYRVIEKSIGTVADIPAVEVAKEAVTNEPAKDPVVFSPSTIVEVGAKSLVHIYDKGSGEKKFAALGVAVGEKGGVLASSLLLPNTPASTYVVTLPDGTEVGLTFVKDNVSHGFTYFTLNYPTDIGKRKITPIDQKNIDSVKLGDNVVERGGTETGNVVSTGIVAELIAVKNADTDKLSNESYIVTDLSLSSSVSGFLLFDTRGHLVALEQAGESGKPPIFVPMSILKTAISALL